METIAKKTINKPTNIIFFIFAILFFSNCGGEDENQDNITDDTASSIKINSIIMYSLNAPSDVAAMLIDNSNLEFNSELLNSPDNVDKYTSNISKALNLGIYTADLTYASYFEQTQISRNYFSVTKDISKELGIINSVDEKHLKMMSETKIDKEKMMQIINESFMNTDAYLLENDRQGIMTMILIGGWIEAEYIAISSSEGSRTKYPELYGKLIDQSISVELMMKMFEDIEDENSKFSELKKDIKIINDAYHKLLTDETDENFKELCEHIKSIRNKYIKK